MPGPTMRRTRASRVPSRVMVARWSGRRRAARDRRRPAGRPRSGRSPSVASGGRRNACSTGPLGSAIASRLGTGSHGPAASMAAMKPGSSPSMRGAGERASASSSAPPIRVRVRKSASVATGAKRLHSMEKPRRAMRGSGEGGSLIAQFPVVRRSAGSPSDRCR